MKTYRNIPDTTYIWNGIGADPEIVYKGHTLNYWDIEDSLYNSYWFILTIYFTIKFIIN